MQQLLKSTDSAVMPLVDSNFSRFVLESPRTYFSVVMLTAMHPQYKCAVCSSYWDTYAIVAQAYNTQYNINLETTPAKVVFFVLDVETGREVFNGAGFQSAPLILVVPPAAPSERPLPITHFSEYLLPQDLVTEPPISLMQHINGLTGLQAVQYNSPTLFVTATTLLVFAFAVIMSRVVRAADISEIVYFKWAYFLGSLIVFSVGVGGLVFCVIRTPPMYGHTRSADGVSAVVFAGQGRDQFTLEGVVIALYTITCSASFVWLYKAPNLPSTILSNVVALAACVCVCVWLSIIIDVYTFKTRWYTISATFPPEYWDWMTSSVKKSSGLMKRLFRIGSYFLYDYKGLEAFKTRFKVLIYDYVNRVLFHKK